MKDMKLIYGNPKIAKLKAGITHQNISGKYIVIEKEDKMSYIFDIPLNEITIAEQNFIQRRTDLIIGNNEDIKIYYGHVGLYGYLVAEDELDSPLKEVSWPEARKYLEENYYD